MIKTDNVDKVIDILEQIGNILRKNRDSNWLPAIENLLSQFLNETARETQVILVRKIIGMYGGMGSFNDLILFDDGNVCYEENEQLDRLRGELYEICNTILVNQ